VLRGGLVIDPRRALIAPGSVIAKASKPANEVFRVTFQSRPRSCLLLGRSRAEQAPAAVRRECPEPSMEQLASALLRQWLGGHRVCDRSFVSEFHGNFFSENSLSSFRPGPWRSRTF
jgi:hypothetical protein